MKTKLIITILLLAASSWAGVSVYFSPQDNCEKVWVNAIGAATNHIYVSCFGIENQRIADALIERAKRGIAVKVCCDKLQAAGKGSLTGQLKAAGIEVIVKKTAVLEHNKMMAIDGRSGIVGSWNLSDRAQAQDNSLVLFSGETNLVSQIETAWQAIYRRDR